MNRRQFVMGALATTAAISGGLWLSVDGNKYPLTITAALEKLKRLKVSQLSSSTNWSVAKTLVHCAQSVEFSMTGFPEHKSDLFKHSVGALAFKAFATKGRMTHNIEEAIPGAPLITSSMTLPQAINRLENALLAFTHFNGALAPHFAYGYLSKPQYELAHVMHFYNHLEYIEIS